MLNLLLVVCGVSVVRSFLFLSFSVLCAAVLQGAVSNAAVAVSVYGAVFQRVCVFL